MKLKRCIGYKGSCCGRVLPHTKDFFFSNGVRNGKQRLTGYCKDDRRKVDGCKFTRNFDGTKKDKKVSKMEYRYGITEEEYNELLNAQEGKCCICEEPETLCRKGSNTPQKLSIEHCHETGRIRGLTCNSCNITIARLERKTKNSTRDKLQILIGYLGFK